MKPFRAVLLASLLALPAGEAGAQSAPRHQATLEAGILSAGLSYARRVGDSPLSVGAGAWAAWEPESTFDRNVWEPIGLTLFGRWRAAPWLHADAGLTGARYLWADDCGECSGTFVGVRSALLVGYRFLFVGPEASVGAASDDRHGTGFGAIWGVQARVLVGWGARPP